ncbi:MAG: hypothetical protein ATN36_03745 [Epulopiscium sp. Nele67-Bin005]|nr:MAG: hypothetical protein ATN36_03745 [Epulopiscium sp. Nele67-Bin005]
MDVLFAMFVGIIVGYKFFPEKYHNHNSKLQFASITVLVFCMGVILGSRPNFFAELLSLGYKSLILAIFPILGSIILVYIGSEKWLVSKNDEMEELHNDLGNHE